MPRVTVRCSETQTETRQQLMAKAQQKASDIVLHRSSGEPVLVVYQRKSASIYYEGAPSAKGRVT